MSLEVCTFQSIPMSVQAAACVFASLSPPCFSKCPFLSPSSPFPLYHFCFPAPFPVPVASTFLFLDAWGFLMTLPAHRSLPYFQAASFYTLSVCCWFLQAPSSEAHVFERERQRLSEVTSRRTAKLGTVSGRGAAWRVQTVNPFSSTPRSPLSGVGRGREQ